MSERPGRLADGMRAVLPLTVAVAGFGIPFGVLARTAGFDPLAAIVFSATTFAGSAQFAAASILEAGGGVGSAVAAAILLNLRYAPIGLSVAPALGGSMWMRLLSAQLVVDESWAVARRPDGSYDRGRLIGAGLTLYVAWTSFTAIGVLGAGAFGDPATLGLDAAFPALFLALLWPQLKERSSVQATVLGACIALALVPFTPPGVPVIAAAGGCLLGIRRR